MTTKPGLDKYLTPKGFWDKFITFTLLGSLVLVVLWLRFAEVAGDGRFFAALLLGLFSGQVAVCLIRISNARPREKWLRLMVLMTWPVSFIVILILASGAIAFGFYSGVGISFCFGYAAMAVSSKFILGKQSE